ncbi:SGNH/GDSL hydrolase family protein [Paracoccus salsus]|uniref:SGNH/GDSL hydrolase family protein n=1 Tax=Paracoccus salsus TaxID=2911061 RepID=UPI001F22BB4F|nr:hypothetical protein [Paracoccus salsus]MCF3974416.1 hypothetical protein [Paracoccus salsus]
MNTSAEAPSLVVVGGSNSLLKNGWVDKLKQVHPQPERVVNLSIGAATSAMGLYRLLTCAEMPDNPVVLWEYALNEANYFAHRQPAKVLIYHTQWLLEACARRGLRVLPVILYNKAEATGAERHRYRDFLAGTFETYGLTPVDAGQLWRAEFGDLPVDRLYADNPHYSVETGFPLALARAVLRQARLATVPSCGHEDGLRFAGKDLRIVFPDSGIPEPFANRILSCDIFSMGADLHFSLTGRLLACFLIASRAEPAITFRSGRAQKGPYSAQISARGTGPARQLKHLLLWSPKDPPLASHGDLFLSPQPAFGASPVVQHTMAWNASADGEAVGTGGLIGLLAEIDI